MKTLIVILSMICASFPVFAATAYFTGQQEMVQTVTHKMVWRCHYNVYGNHITALFEGHCPSSIEVQ